MPVAGSIAANARAPAGQRRPATCPGNYITTAFGYFDPSCANALAKADVLRRDDCPCSRGQQRNRRKCIGRLLGSCTNTGFPGAGATPELIPERMQTPFPVEGAKCLRVELSDFLEQI